jgi:hypothetical protein
MTASTRTPANLPQDGQSPAPASRISPAEDARQRPGIAPLGPIERIDWGAIRDMVRAPAYFQRVAQSSFSVMATERGASVEDRGAKLSGERRAKGGAS